MSDGLTVLGPDGIRRSYDEHYDTMMDVKQDPTGAWQAIQMQHYRIQKLEILIKDLFILLDKADEQKLESLLRLIKATVEGR